MEFTVEQASILTPHEMRELRRLAGWTLATLARNSQVHIALLSQYENAWNGLRPDQLSECKRLLLDEIAEKAAKIAVIVARENAAHMAAAS